MEKCGFIRVEREQSKGKRAFFSTLRTFKGCNLCPNDHRALDCGKDA